MFQPVIMIWCWWLFWWQTDMVIKPSWDHWMIDWCLVYVIFLNYQRNRNAEDLTQKDDCPTREIGIFERSSYLYRTWSVQRCSRNKRLLHCYLRRNCWTEWVHRYILNVHHCWYHLQAKYMTAMGVQVVGTILNKTVHTGDNFWGLVWSDIPAALQVYVTGVIHFEFITYNVLAGISLRNLYPDPDIECKILVHDQKTACSCFLTG